MSVIISNTTPINYLVLIDHIAVLHHLYARIIIPQAVFGELQEEGTPAKVKAWVAAHPTWLEVRTVAVSPDASLALLDVGEREAIRLAQELETDALIMDEPAGREAAKRQGIRVIGTLRVLYDAAVVGLCDLAQAYERLQHTTNGQNIQNQLFTNDRRSQVTSTGGPLR